MVYNILNKDILNNLNNYIIPELKKKQNGTVFTNTNLINKKLDLLPKKVWNDPKLTWLDPCCGPGNYGIVIYFRLMQGLKNIIKEEEKRRKHIIENMLYFVEFDEDYVNILKEIFLYKKYKLNIFLGSYVYLHTYDENISVFNKDIFKNEYDIIIGNPPYQKANKVDPTKLSAKPLYHLFVDKSIELLKKNGYLLFIHPVSWRRKSKEIKIINSLLNKTIKYIYTNNKFTEFGISAPFINYYLLQNKDYNSNYKTKYDTFYNDIHYKGKVHLNNKLEYLPVLLTNESISIINKIINADGDKLNVKLESKLSTSKKNISIEKTDYYKYKNLHTYSQKKGFIYRYSYKKHPSQDKLKILMNFKGGYKYLNPFIDNGELGITDNSMYMIINDDNKDFILNFLKSELMYFLLMITTYNYGANQKNEFHIMNTFRIPRNINDLYEYYNLTQLEIEFINTSIKAS